MTDSDRPDNWDSLNEFFVSRGFSARAEFGRNPCLLVIDMSVAQCDTAYGVGAWVPSFFIRSYGWTPVEAGRDYGLIIAVLGTLGVGCGGVLADILAARFRSGRMMVLVLSPLLTLPFLIAYPLVGDAPLSLLLVGFGTFFGTLPTGAGASSLQEIIPNQMRGFFSALLIFLVSLLGLGLGPTAIAAFTDYVLKDENQLLYSLAIVPTLANSPCS